MVDLYLYRARVTKVYDGDSITCDIDLGLNVWLKNQKLRLYGIDTPEIRGEEREEGLVARDWLRTQIPEDGFVLIRTHKDRAGKYGRWLAEVIVDEINLNEELIKLGMAEPYYP